MCPPFWGHSEEGEGVRVLPSDHLDFLGIRTRVSESPSGSPSSGRRGRRVRGGKMERGKSFRRYSIMTGAAPRPIITFPWLLIRVRVVESVEPCGAAEEVLMKMEIWKYDKLSPPLILLRRRNFCWWVDGEKESLFDWMVIWMIRKGRRNKVSPSPGWGPFGVCCDFFVSPWIINSSWLILTLRGNIHFNKPQLDGMSVGVSVCTYVTFRLTRGRDSLPVFGRW